MRKRSALAVLLNLLAVASVQGQMVFEKTLVEVEADPDADLVTAEFHFTIKGERPVTIAEYDASCSCLEAKISGGGKLTWNPGESGTVKGEFKMGTFKGTVEKPIVLRLKGDPVPKVLKVRVHIPVLFDVQPPTLFWDQGGDGSAQTFKMTVNHDRPIHITQLSGTNEQFKYELKKIRDGWEYEVVVTPKTVETRAFGLLRIRTDSEFRRHQSYQGFMVVRRPRPVAGQG